MALIYCVEDDAGIRELISCALGTAGHSVKGFVTGEELFEALPLQNHSPRSFPEWCHG